MNKQQYQQLADLLKQVYNEELDEASKKSPIMFDFICKNLLDQLLIVKDFAEVRLKCFEDMEKRTNSLCQSYTKKSRSN